MSKKEKVSIVRSDDFEEVDAILTEALVSLEEANARVSDLLESETHDTLSDAAEQKIAQSSGQDREEPAEGSHAAPSQPAEKETSGD